MKVEEQAKGARGVVIEGSHNMISNVTKAQNRRHMPPRAREIEQDLRELRPVLTLKEAADTLRVSPRTVKRWAAAGKIRLQRTDPGPGGRLLVLRSEVARVLARIEDPCPFPG